MRQSVPSAAAVIVRTALCAAVAMFVLPATLLQAQPSDSTIFRAGQWGAEFSFGGSFAGLGVQRFSTPTRAWVASVRGRLQDWGGDTDSLNFGLFGVSLSHEQFEDAGLSLGHRWYRPLTADVLQHLTVGALASATRSTRFRRAAPDDALRSIVGGVYAEVGAMWMVTRRLSLGATWTAQATLGRFTEEKVPFAGSESRGTFTRFAAGDMRVQSSLFF